MTIERIAPMVAEAKDSAMRLMFFLLVTRMEDYDIVFAVALSNTLFDTVIFGDF